MHCVNKSGIPSPTGGHALQLAQNTRDPDTAKALLQIVAEHVARAEEAVAKAAAPADAAAQR